MADNRSQLTNFLSTSGGAEGRLYEFSVEGVVEMPLSHVVCDLCLRAPSTRLLTSDFPARAIFLDGDNDSKSV